MKILFLFPFLFHLAFVLPFFGKIFYCEERYLWHLKNYHILSFWEGKVYFCECDIEKDVMEFFTSLGYEIRSMCVKKGVFVGQPCPPNLKIGNFALLTLIHLSSWYAQILGGEDILKLKIFNLSLILFSIYLVYLIGGIFSAFYFALNPLILLMSLVFSNISLATFSFLALMYFLLKSRSNWSPFAAFVLSLVCVWSYLPFMIPIYILIVFLGVVEGNKKYRTYLAVVLGVFIGATPYIAYSLFGFQVEAIFALKPVDYAKILFEPDLYLRKIFFYFPKGLGTYLPSFPFDKSKFAEMIIIILNFYLIISSTKRKYAILWILNLLVLSSFKFRLLAILLSSLPLLYVFETKSSKQKICASLIILLLITYNIYQVRTNFFFYRSYGLLTKEEVEKSLQDQAVERCNLIFSKEPIPVQDKIFIRVLPDEIFEEIKSKGFCKQERGK